MTVCRVLFFCALCVMLSSVVAVAVASPSLEGIAAEVKQDVMEVKQFGDNVLRWYADALQEELRRGVTKASVALDGASDNLTAAMGLVRGFHNTCLREEELSAIALVKASVRNAKEELCAVPDAAPKDIWRDIEAKARVVVEMSAGVEKDVASAQAVADAAAEAVELWKTVLLEVVPLAARSEKAVEGILATRNELRKVWVVLGSVNCFEVMKPLELIKRADTQLLESLDVGKEVVSVVNDAQGIVKRVMLKWSELAAKAKAFVAAVEEAAKGKASNTWTDE